MSENLSYLAGRKGIENNLFEKLGHAATVTGSPDPEAMESLRKEFLFGKANVLGTSSFYDFLKEENKGKKVYTCNGSACLTAGTQEKLKGRLLQHFKKEEIGEMCCLGRCHENKAFQFGGKNYSGDASEQLEQIIQTAEIKNDQYKTGFIGHQLLTGPSYSIKTIQSLAKDWLSRTPNDLIQELLTSNLRGRGGAGFPMAIKLSACREASSSSGTKFIVCNADEGDPGAYSDRYLMEHQPELVLLGMIMAGYMAGASYGVIYIRAEYPESITTIEKTVRDFYAAGLAGPAILKTNFSFDFKIIKAQGAYICGEETALLSSIEGQRPEVRVRPPYPAQSGLFNLPTVVNNVETLACVPVVLKTGGAGFAGIGKGKSTGTKLVSLDGFFNRPGIYEADMGTPLDQIINELGQGFRTPVKALHIGGPLGGLVPLSMISKLTLDFESFNENGFLLGHASIVCLPQEFPIIRYLEHLFQFTSHESCGKCFPCRLGSKRGAEMLEKAINNNYKIDRQLLDDLLETLESGSLCMLGGGLPLPVRNALKYFDNELRTYFKTTAHA